MKHYQFEFIGRNKINSIPNIIEENASKVIFLVTGNQSYTSCGAKTEIDQLLKNYQLVRFYDFSPNPTFEEALIGSRLFEEFGCDFILAIGGGSAIDIAKTINVFQAHKGSEKDLATGKINPVNPLVPACVVPTTAGTGSEATHFAVTYVDDVKYSLADISILPKYVILDPRFTDNLSPYITACTGFDALAQAIESYWAVGATDESRAFSAKAIPLLKNNIENAVHAGDRISRDKMLLGANYAGKAINISKTTAPHALSYGITSLINLPHGHSVALTLGNVFTLHDQKTLPPNVQSRLRSLYQKLGTNSSIDTKVWWYQLMEKCGLETNFKTLGLSKKHIEKIIDSVNIERLSNHPAKLDNEDLTRLFQ